MQIRIYEIWRNYVIIFVFFECSWKAINVSLLLSFWTLFLSLGRPADLRTLFHPFDSVPIFRLLGLVLPSPISLRLFRFDIFRWSYVIRWLTFLTQLCKFKNIKLTRININTYRITRQVVILDHSKLQTNYWDNVTSTFSISKCLNINGGFGCHVWGLM